VRDGLATATPERSRLSGCGSLVPGVWRLPDDGRWACQLRQDAQHADSEAAGHSARRGLGRISGAAQLSGLAPWLAIVGAMAAGKGTKPG
jgi:hypothetical protein